MMHIIFFLHDQEVKKMLKSAPLQCIACFLRMFHVQQIIAFHLFNDCSVTDHSLEKEHVFQSKKGDTNSNKLIDNVSASTVKTSDREVFLQLDDHLSQKQAQNHSNCAERQRKSSVDNIICYPHRAKSHCQDKPYNRKTYDLC